MELIQTNWQKSLATTKKGVQYKRGQGQMVIVRSMEDKIIRKFDEVFSLKIEKKSAYNQFCIQFDAFEDGFRWKDDEEKISSGLPVPLVKNQTGAFEMIKACKFEELKKNTCRGENALPGTVNTIFKFF